MITEIAYQLISQYSGKLSFFDKWAGLVVPLKKMVDKTEKTFPVYINHVANCNNSQLMDLLPSSDRKSVIYVEKNGEPTVEEIRTNYYIVTAPIRIVCWYNLDKINGGLYLDDGVIINNILQNTPKSLADNLFEYSRSVKLFFKGSASGAGIFDKYTYNEVKTQFTTFPYGAVALDYEVSYVMVKCSDPLSPFEACGQQQGYDCNCPPPLVDPIVAYTQSEKDKLAGIEAGAEVNDPETDPIFTDWDKSTGISITESQISDLQAYLTNIAGQDLSTADNSTSQFITLADVPADLDNKVKYDANDAANGYLKDKTVAGIGISLAEGTGGDVDKLKITNSAPDQVVSITAGTNIDSIAGAYPNFTINASTQAGTTDEKVKYDAGDPTAGYVADKFVAGTGISVAEGIGAEENKLVITNTDKGSDVDLSGLLDETAHDLLDHTGLTGVPSIAGLLDETAHDLLDHTGLTGVLSAETDPLSLHLDQTVPQAVINGAPVFDAIDFDITPSLNTPTEGRLQWNATDGTLNLGMSAGAITQQIGQELFTKVYNDTGVIIPNGSAVYFNGRQGNRPKVVLARSDAGATSKVMGIATEDIPITGNKEGYITTYGYVRQIKTNYSGSGIWGTTWVEGDALYVSKTDAGVLTNVEPSAPHHADIVGYVGIVGAVGVGSILIGIERHKTLSELSDVDGTPLNTTGQMITWHNDTQLFDFDHNISEFATVAEAKQFAVDVNRYGFVSRLETNLSFDGTSTITLADKGSGWSYYRAGIKYTITGNKTIPCATPMVDGTLYYIYIDSTTGTLVSGSGWTLNDTKVPVCTLYWDSTLTPKYILADERHTCRIDRAYHREHHFADGTETRSPGTLAGLVAASDTDTDKVFSLTDASIFDEDLFFDIFDLAKPNGNTDVYPIVYRTGSGTYKWVLSDMPFKYTDTAGTNPYGFIEYDNAGTSTPSAANRFVNTYVFLCNSVANNETDPEITTSSTRFFILQGRGSYTSAALAQAEKLLISAGFPVAEGVGVYQITWSTTNRPDTVKGRCRYVSTQPINTNVTISAVALDYLHNSLLGIDGGAINEYYHLTEAQHTIATQSATTDRSGYLTDTDWDTFNGKLSNVVEDLTPQLGGVLDTQTNALLGGTAVGSTLTLKATTANGTLTGKGLVVQVGNNGGTEAVTVLNNGNIGIGRDVPVAKMDVYSSAAPTNSVLANLEVGSDAHGTLQIINNQATWQFSVRPSTDTNTGGFSFYVKPAGGSWLHTMCIQKAGNVGIGTNSPTSRLHVVNNYNGQTIIQSQNVDTGNAAQSVIAAVCTGSVGFFAQGANFTSTVNFQANGGTLYSSQAMSNGFTIACGNASAGIRFVTNGAERLVFNAAGSMGLGVASPTATLHLKAGTATAGTAPVKLTAGTVNTAPEAGAIEFDGTDLWISI